MSDSSTALEDLIFSVFSTTIKMVINIINITGGYYKVQLTKFNLFNDNWLICVVVRCLSSVRLISACSVGCSSQLNMVSRSGRDH